VGLGLVIVVAADELLGGALELISAPGRGTTVRLVIPLHPAPA
jgi:signal transduction histidine kinase